MPPKKKAKSIVIEAIDDLERDYENEDEFELNVCKVSLGKWRNIKHWKKVNQVFVDEYDIDAETLQRRSMSYIQLIPVENLESISQEWKDCFIEETERYLTLNFHVWRIRPDDQITQVFENYQQKKSRDDSVYRYMFKRLDSAYLSKAIISYTKLSNRRPHCLFYLLKYMISISPDVSHIYDVIDFIYTRQDISHNERIEYKKAYIFEIFPPMLDKVIFRKRNKQWRTPFLFALRMLVELHYENNDPERRVLKMVIHLFKKIANYREYSKITNDYINLKGFYSDLIDFQKSRQLSIPDDVSIKSEDTDGEVIVQMLKDHTSSDRDNEAIVFHSLFLYTLAWNQFLDPGYELCFLTEYFDAERYIGNEVVLKEESDSVKKMEKNKFVVWDSVKSKLDAFRLMIDVRNFLNSYFPDVYKSFLEQTRMENKYFSKQIQMNFQLVDGNSIQIQESLKSLFSENRQFPAFTFVDIYISQIGNFIRLNLINEALRTLLTFAQHIPKLFPPEENVYDPKKAKPRSYPKDMARPSADEREIQIRPLTIENIVDVLVNFLMVILSKQLHDKKVFDVCVEKLLILSQHNWPQYSPLVNYCFKAFEASGVAMVRTFREHIFQSNLIEEFSGLKHRCPNIKFVMTLDRAPLTGEIVDQIFLDQIGKSIKELPMVFYFNFILSSFPTK